MIVLFGINSSVADALLTQLQFDVGFIALLIFELFASVVIGYTLYKLLELVLSLDIHMIAKTILVLASGFGIFLLSKGIRAWTHANLPFEVLIEPLLVCMIGGFLVTSFCKYCNDFSRILHNVGPPIYVVFFTLTGASLAMDILVKTWPIALVLFFVRLVAIGIGSFSGGTIAGDPAQHNRLSWMAYVTQAGVGLGLAKQVSAEFPTWGAGFATVIISVIVINQIVGPPLLKWVIHRVGESHVRGERGEFDGVHDAMILGIKAESVALARQLQLHGWQVKMLGTSQARHDELEAPDLDVNLVTDLDLETLRVYDGEHADAIICFLPNDISYQSANWLTSILAPIP